MFWFMFLCRKRRWRRERQVRTTMMMTMMKMMRKMTRKKTKLKIEIRVWIVSVTAGPKAEVSIL